MARTGIQAAVLVIFLFGISFFSTEALARRADSPLHALGEAYQNQYIGIKKLGPNPSPDQVDEVTRKSFTHANELMAKEMHHREEKRINVMKDLLKSTGKEVTAINKMHNKGQKGYKKALVKGGNGLGKGKGKGKGKGGGAAGGPVTTGPVSSGKGRDVGGPSQQGGGGGAEHVDYKKNTNPDDDDDDTPKRAAPAATPAPAPAAKKKQRVMINGVLQER